MTEQKYQELVKELNEHHHNYHVKDAPTISDAKYDKLFKELQEIEQQHPSWILPNSPTQRVGEIPESERKKFKHPIRMYSLSNVFNEKELASFYKRFAALRREDPIEVDQYYCDCKMDGLALSIQYQNGQITLALTRGDGIKGEDVTANVLMIPNIPRRISTKHTILVRGEVVVHEVDFISINRLRLEKNLPPFSNPRNYAAGSLKQKDPKVTRERMLRFYAWELLCPDSKSLTQEEQIEMLTNLGFNVPMGKMCYSLEEILSFINEVSRQRQDLLYQIDGVVIKENNPKIRTQLGWNNHDPLWATAWKFTAAGAQTVVKNIYWNMGRTGRLTPVAKLEPTVIDGVTIQDVTLNNVDYVERTKLGDGGTIMLIRSGDVIPKVSEILSAGKYQGIPDKCPYCGTPTERHGADLKCINPECKEKLKALLTYMVSKEVLDIHSLGKSTISELVDSGAVKSFLDVFSPIDYNGDKIKSDTLDRLVKECIDINFMKLLMTLGIPGMGRAIASKIALEVENTAGLISALRDEKKLEQLMVNEGIKTNLRNWYAIEYNLDLLDKLKKMNLPYCS